MKYKFSKAQSADYEKLKPFIERGHELTKSELLSRCSGAIDLQLLHYIKELEFEKIGRDNNDDLYLR